MAACPNASAMLFTSAKMAHLGFCRRASRSARDARSAMVQQMDVEGFGGCTYHGECQEACPKEISIDWITVLNRDYITASLTRQEEAVAEAGL